MSIRSTHIVNDIQDCFYELLSQLATDTAPWTDWDILRAFPQQDVNTAFDKPIVYITTPARTGSIGQQGGKPVFVWEIVLGVWIDRQAGNIDELGVMAGRIFDLFNDHNTLNKKTFTVTLGTTEYASTTLLAMGIQVTTISGPRHLEASDLKEFRQEFTVELIA